MTFRDYINIYIIKYKLKKNSVKNTMWNKCCGFFFFLCCCCCCYFIHESSHSFSDELQYFSARNTEVQGRWQWSYRLMVQLLEPVLWGLWHLMAPRLYTVGWALIWCFKYIFCFHVFSHALSDSMSFVYLPSIDNYITLPVANNQM